MLHVEVCWCIIWESRNFVLKIWSRYHISIIYCYVIGKSRILLLQQKVANLISFPAVCFILKFNAASMRITEFCAPSLNLKISFTQFTAKLLRNPGFLFHKKKDASLATMVHGMLKSDDASLGILDFCAVLHSYLTSLHTPLFPLVLSANVLTQTSACSKCSHFAWTVNGVAGSSEVAGMVGEKDVDGVKENSKHLMDTHKKGFISGEHPLTA